MQKNSCSCLFPSASAFIHQPSPLRYILPSILSSTPHKLLRMYYTWLARRKTLALWGAIQTSLFGFAYTQYQGAKAASAATRSPLVTRR